MSTHSDANNTELLNGSDFVQPRRVSRDEMNLAEFPLTVLSTRSNQSLKTLEFRDSVRGRNGETVERSWIITGADKFGLPTSSDDEVLLGLLKLTVERTFTDRKVFFTRYELLRALRWTTEGRSYVRLQRALDRLSGVRIKATNAFYDNESKAHSTRNFGIIDAYEINDGRSLEPKPSFFIWSEVIFKSFQAGFIKKLDLDFYLDLQSAVSKRLYRYLDKHFWYKSRIQINIFTLAHEKIGISRNYRYASSLRQQLDPALEELIKARFISGYSYLGKGLAMEVAIVGSSSSARRSHKTSGNSGKVPETDSSNLRQADKFKPVGEDNLIDKGIDSVSELTEMLITRGVNSNQAGAMLYEYDAATLRRIRRIIDHFDFLVSSGSTRVSKNPAGFLYFAVKNPSKFVLPGEASIRAQQPLKFRQSVPNKLESRRNSASRSVAGNSVAGNSVAGNSAAGSEDFEARYLIERRHQIEKLKKEVEPQVLKRIHLEVEQALSKLKGVISENRFQQALQIGVEERLAKLFSVPEISEWLEQTKPKSFMAH